MKSTKEIVEFINQEKLDLLNLKKLENNINKLTKYRKFVIIRKLRVYDRILQFITEGEDVPDCYYKLVELIEKGERLKAVKLYWKLEPVNLKEATEYINGLTIKLNK